MMIITVFSTTSSCRMSTTKPFNLTTVMIVMLLLMLLSMVFQHNNNNKNNNMEVTALAIPARTSASASTSTSTSSSTSTASTTWTSTSTTSSTTWKTVTTMPINLGPPVCVYHQVNVPTTMTSTTRPSSSETANSTTTARSITVHDVTPTLQDLLKQSGMEHGTLTVLSRHTTTAVCINEWESRLVQQDIPQVLLQLVPPDERCDSNDNNNNNNNNNVGGGGGGGTSSSHKRVIRYAHNDIDLRPDGHDEAERCRQNGWKIDTAEGLQQWRMQEPTNAHSHLLSMMLGNSECIPVVEGRLMLGQWQSVLLVDLDPGPSPRSQSGRNVGVQLMGYSACSSN